MARTPNGFHFSRDLGGASHPKTGSYQVDNGNPKPIFIGQAVTLSSGKVVEHTSTSTTPVLGVVRAVYSSTKNRPLTHNLPSTGNYIPASTAGFVDVMDDPRTVFRVVADAGVSAGNIGHLCDITASPSGNTTTGVSNMKISSTTFAAQTSANVKTLPFRVVGLHPSEVAPAGSGYSGNALYIEVVVNDHLFNGGGIS